MQSNFIEIALRNGCSPVNLLYSLRTPFPKNTSGWLLLMLSTLSAIDRLIRCSFLPGIHLHRGHWFITQETVFVAQVILPDSQRQSRFILSSIQLFWRKKEIQSGAIPRIFNYSIEHFDLTEKCKDLPVSSLKIKMNAIIFPGSKQIPQKRTRKYTRNISKSLPEYLILQEC